MSTGYNGWTNYETWAVNLQLNNDEDAQRAWNAAAVACWDDAGDDNDEDEVLSRSEAARYALADQLKTYITENAPTDCGGLYIDLLNAALSDVDWSDIADGFLDSCEGYVSLPAKP